MAIVLPCWIVMRASAGGPDGIFFNDTRYLSQLEMLLNGRQPLLLGSNVRDDNSTLTVDVTNPDIYVDQDLVQPKDTQLTSGYASTITAISLSNFVCRSLLEAISRICSRFGASAVIAAVWRSRKLLAMPAVALTYHGLDGIRRRTQLKFEPAPEQLAKNAASYEFELQANESRSVFVTVQCNLGADELRILPFRKGLRAAFQEQRNTSRGMATVVTSNEIFTR